MFMSIDGSNNVKHVLISFYTIYINTNLFNSFNSYIFSFKCKVLSYTNIIILIDIHILHFANHVQFVINW